jgi:hypothetical protein
MNTYAKFCANVWVAKCEQEYQKGDIIPVTTKHGKENDCIVFNRVAKSEGFYYYSIIRADGMNAQEYAKKKAERLEGWAKNAEERSNNLWEASKEGSDFLSLGEPIKVGHHSEGKHRRLIERNNNRMGKSIEEQKKAEYLNQKSEYWKEKENDINLSMPESVEFYECKVEEAKAKHQNLKDNPSERSHSMSLQYAKKEVKTAEENLRLAIILWGE